jgi:imipenem/basic amino acid-specific outer membrane pore
MRKAVVLSIAAVVGLSAAGVGETLVAGKMDNQLRLSYVDQDNAIDTDTYGTSLGGILKYESGEWNGVKLGVGAYISQKIHPATGSFEDAKANPDLFGEDTKSYAYVGEAYINYTLNDFNLRVGRQLIDTPFADTDDIRMHPNTFEAAIASYTGFEGTTFVGGVVTRFAGYDSGDDISKFKKLAGDESNGAVVLGVVNESIENLAVQAWYYNIDKLAEAFYTDVTYTIPFSETMGLELAGQYVYFDESNNAVDTTTGLYNIPSNIDGSVYGVSTAFNISGVTLGAAYNKASNNNGKVVVNGFGGGPYMTSMEEMTIDGFEDVKAYQLSAELDMANAGIEGLTFTTLYGDFKSTPADMHIKEIDLIAAYEIKEGLVAEVSYAMVNDKNDNTLDDGTGTLYDGGYDRFLARISYNF